MGTLDVLGNALWGSTTNTTYANTTAGYFDAQSLLQSQQHFLYPGKIFVGGDGQAPAAVAPPAIHPDLAWLDGRINEMRVAL